jgi:hypothetical protein
VRSEALALMTIARRILNSCGVEHRSGYQALPATV